jgi:hypothetical protein
VDARVRRLALEQRLLNYALDARQQADARARVTSLEQQLARPGLGPSQRQSLEAKLSKERAAFDKREEARKEVLGIKPPVLLGGQGAQPRQQTQGDNPKTSPWSGNPVKQPEQKHADEEKKSDKTKTKPKK